MRDKVKILLVEDDQNLGSLVMEGLESKDFSVHWFQNGEEAKGTFKETKFDLCLLDIMLPDIDGFELAKAIRSVDQAVPILFITAKELPEDRLKGFESGGDDYITKPFLMKELLYRIDVFLRRSNKEQIPEQRLTGQNWVLDQDTMAFKYLDKEHRLTKREFEVFDFLLKHRSRIVPREDILFNIWGDDDYFMGRSLDVFIARIRSILKDIPELDIINIRGVGFRLEVADPKK